MLTFFVEKRGTFVAYGRIGNERLMEIFFVKEKEHFLGSIFRGRVVESSQHSDFFMVDIGLPRLGVLRNKDMCRRRNEGDTVLVQVTRDAYDEKGAKLSEFLRIAGKYLLLTPYESRVLFPPKTDLLLKKSDYYKICREKCGYRLRTAGAKISIEMLKEEYDKLWEEYRVVEQERNYLPVPKLLKKEEDKVLKYFRDFLSSSFRERGIVNDLSYFDILHEKFGDRLELSLDPEFRTDRNLIISAGMTEMKSSRVKVDSGANIVLERTEAMNVVDVNSGGFSKTGIRYSMAYQVNDSVLEELVRQIRLRDLEGIIVVDFIDMNEEERGLLKERLVHLLEEDPRTTVFDFTALGLLELTRKRYGGNDITMQDFLSYQ